MRLKPIAITIPVLLIACLALTLTLGHGDDNSEEDAWFAFGMAMDKAFGSKGWTSSGHSFQNGTLTVEGFSSRPESLGAGEGEGTKPGGLTVRTITVQGMPSSQLMGRILVATDWAGTTDETLAQLVTLQGVTLGMENEEFAVDLTLDAAQFSQITLAAALSDKFSGSLGYLKATRLGKVSYTGLKASFGLPKNKGGDGLADMTLDSYSLGGLDFSAEGLFGDGSILDVISSARMANVDWSNIAVAIPSGNGEDKWEITMAGLSIKGLDGIGKYGDITLKELRAKFPNLTDGMESADLRLAGYSIQNLDMRDLFKGILSAMGGAYLNDKPKALGFEGFLENSFTMAGYFTYPYSFDSWKLTGFDLTSGGLDLGIASLDYQGPIRKNVIPNAKISLSGGYLDVKDLASVPKPLKEPLGELTEFLGQKSFKGGGAINVTYDPGKGSALYDYAGWSVESLGEVSFAMELTGLTQPFVDGLAKIPASSFEKVLEIPGILGLGIGDLSFDYKDSSLTEKIIAKVSELKEQDPTELTAELQQGVSVVLDPILSKSRYPAAHNAIARASADYLKNPKSFSVTSKPQNPSTILTFWVLLKGDAQWLNLILDSFNIGISVNGEPPTPLSFRKRQ
ncbi:MAG: hypothetical protein LBF40_07820 [Deltaproteobacteria bacterium]|jgi:hypothetical protein|nr:hypothetical protein [Deltaproteobacteria bacterium]